MPGTPGGLVHAQATVTPLSMHVRRSYYFPVKDVADGDLCEQFSQLPIDKQRQVRPWAGGGAALGEAVAGTLA